MNEVTKAYERERIRLKAVTGKFLATKEPAECFHMMMQHVMGMRAEFNTLIQCLSRPEKRVDDEMYFKLLIHNLQVQIDLLLAGLPGVTCDENGRLHGGRVINPKTLG